MDSELMAYKLGHLARNISKIFVELSLPVIVQFDDETMSVIIKSSSGEIIIPSGWFETKTIEELTEIVERFYDDKRMA